MGPLTRGKQRGLGAEAKEKKEEKHKEKKKGKLSRVLLKLETHPKAALLRYDPPGRLQFCLVSDSFNVQLIPQPAVLADPNGSKGWKLQRTESHARDGVEI